MSSDETPKQPSREDLEERVIALLMGELDVAAGKEIEAAIANNPSLKEFHRRMQNTFGFVQEAVGQPEISKAPTPLKLSDERREELLAKFTVVKLAKTAKRPNRKWFWLEVAAVLAIIGVLAGMTLPALKGGRPMADAISMVEQTSGAFAMQSGEPAAGEASSRRTDVEYGTAPDAEGFDPLESMMARRNMESHLGNSEAKTATGAGLSEAQQSDLRSKLQPKGKSQVYFKNSEAAADEEVEPSPVSLSRSRPQPVQVAATPVPPAAPPVVNLSDELATIASNVASEPDAPVTAPMRNIEVDAERPVALSIVLPQAREEQEMNSRNRTFMPVPKYTTNWEEKGGRASRDKESAASVDFVAPPTGEKTVARVDADLGEKMEQLNVSLAAAPRLAGVYEKQQAAGKSVDSLSFGVMPPTGDPQPISGDATAVARQTKTPAFGFGGAQLSGFDESKSRRIEVAEAWSRKAKGVDDDADFISADRGRGAQEATRQKALFFDTEVRRDREADAMSINGGQSLAKTPAATPTTSFESITAGGMASGLAGGGGGLGGDATLGDRRRLKKRAPATGEQAKAETARLSEIRAENPSSKGAITTARQGGMDSRGGSAQGLNSGGNQSGQAVSQRGFSVTFNGVADASQLSRLATPDTGQQQLFAGEARQAGQAGGQGQSPMPDQAQSQGASGKADGFVTWGDQYGRSSASQSKLAAELELRGRQRELNRELAQRRKAVDHVVEKKLSKLAQQQVRFAQTETESLRENLSELSDLQAQLSPVQEMPETESKPRLLGKRQRLGIVAGRASSVRGVAGFETGDDYGMTSAAAANREELRQKSKPAPPSVSSSPAPTGFTRQQNAPRDAAANTQNYLWAGKTSQADSGLGEQSTRGDLSSRGTTDASGPAPARTTASHWAYQPGVDREGDGLARGQQGERSVDDLFVETPAAGARVGNKINKAFVDFDDDSMPAGADMQDLSEQLQTSWLAQNQRRYFSDQIAPGDTTFAWGKQDGKPSDQPASPVGEDAIPMTPGSTFRFYREPSASKAEPLRRNLALGSAGQAPSPATAQKLYERSSGEGDQRDNKKLPGDAAYKSQARVSEEKPDLVAPGTFILSQRSNDSTRTRLASPQSGGTIVAAIVPDTPAEELGLEVKDAEEPARVVVRPAKPKTLKPKPEILTKDNAFSTFSLNVSDVAFKLASASLKAGKLPDPETVRSEEFLNAFNYHDPAPRGNEKLAFAWDRARNPFAHNRDFLRFSIQTAARGRESGQPLNLVVLLDASGSMERSDRIAIVRQMLSVLAGQLKPADRISVVAFARTPWLLVDGMKGGQPKDLLDRVINITPQGGTNIEIGLNLAYEIARRHYLPQGNNRVIVLTDGAANLGNVDPEALKAKVEEQRKKNIALDCFGVGWEGYNDDLLETLSRNGDGRYGFINDPAEARDGFANLLAGALQVAAANVKAQIEFNQKRVIAYRQIGYTKHQLKKEQFRDNTVDAAEIGAAESGTAMYSIQVDRNGVGPLATVRVRYKIPATGRYVEEEWELPYDPAPQRLEDAKASMRLATVAASFAEWMAANPHAGSVSLRDLQRYLNGVPEEFSSDERPKQLRTMLQQARRLSGE